MDTLVPFNEAVNSNSIVSVSRQIRDLIGHSIDNHMETWAAIAPTLKNPGRCGSTQFDHCFVAMVIKQNIPELKKFDGLTEKDIWGHFEAVLKQRGYKMVRGYIDGHTSDDIVKPDIKASDESQEQSQPDAFSVL